MRVVLCSLLALTACSPPAGRAMTAPASEVPDATVIEHVTVIPMDRPGVLEDQSVVVSGDRITAVASADRVSPPASARRIDGRGKFLVPGLVDMHAHAIEAADLELYAAVGVTRLRVMAATPVAIALRDEKPAGKVLRPAVYVEGLLTDGDSPIWPFARVVATPADVAGEIALHRRLLLPSVKVYSRLTRAAYDALVQQGHAAGLRIVGHVPADVGLEHALASGQRSIEHLTGYAEWLVPANSPKPSRGSLRFEHADEARIPEIARRTRAAGAWNCPTVVLFASWNRDGAALRRLPGMQDVAPATVDAWAADLPEATNEQERGSRQRNSDRIRALVGALHREGARLLVGTDSGNPGIVPGFAVLDEIAALVEFGVPAWDALGAATSGAAEFLGEDREFGTIAAGRQADLLLVAANPLDDVANLRRREGVMLRGVWHTATDLDARLTQRLAVNAIRRSAFEGVAAPVPDGAREFAGRFENSNGGIRTGEERLFIDRRADGSRIARAELADGSTTGLIRVVVELGGAGRSFRQDHPGGILMALAGVLDARREGEQMRVTVSTPFGDEIVRTLDAPRDALIGGRTLAPDVLMHDRVSALGVGDQADLPIVAVSPGMAPRLDSVRIRARRTSDGTRRLGDRDVQVRVYQLELLIGPETVPGRLELDRDGHLVEQRLGSQRIVRVE